MKLLQNVMLLVIVFILSITMLNANEYPKSLNEFKLIRGVVVKVVDGDTLKIKTTRGYVRNYRLAGIDTPESVRNKKAKNDIRRCRINECKMIHLGLQAKELVETYYQRDKRIYFYIVDTGRYGRPVIWIKGPLQDFLVTQGLAVVEDYKNLPKYILKKLYLEEKQARRARRGIWKYFKNKCM